MSSSPKSNGNRQETNTSAEQQMQALRELVLGKDGQYVKQHMHSHARELVGSVVVEALKDRQKSDDALEQVLVPTVEKSVESSVKNHSDQFIGHLYPLVGRLVRKSVTAFLSEFLEKTNQLLEHSLTPKGISWRIKAWHAGVSFSQYVASKTFAFRVEQVLLIHRDAGILLNSVANDENQATDADLVSGMLTAINDFVSDSFTSDSAENEQHLAVVKTDDFTLVIERGPQLMLVAAVTGNIPQDISTKFQITNEKIHSLYNKEIADFQGDTAPFDETEGLLRACLLSELKPEHEEQRKKPVLALFFILLLLILAGFYGYQRHKQNQLSDLVSTLNDEPGILITELETQGLSRVYAEVLRDPQAQVIDNWLSTNQIASENVAIFERQYLSLEPQIVKKRLEGVLEKYPQLSLNWEKDLPILKGTLANIQKLELTTELMTIPGLQNISDIVEPVLVEELDTLEDDNPEILNALFEINTAKIERTQIEFELGKDILTHESKRQLDALANYLRSAITLSKKLKLNVGLIIMGASDSSGSAQFNQALSRKRAEVTQQYLSSIGIDPGYLNAIGLGVVEIKATGDSARKVIFNVVKFKTE